MRTKNINFKYIVKLFTDEGELITEKRCKTYQDILDNFPIFGSLSIIKRFSKRTTEYKQVKTKRKYGNFKIELIPKKPEEIKEQIKKRTDEYNKNNKERRQKYYLEKVKGNPERLAIMRERYRVNIQNNPEKMEKRREYYKEYRRKKKKESEESKI